MQYKAISLPPEDSQFLSTRQFGVNEICRIFRVPPHMVQDLEHATFSILGHPIYTSGYMPAITGTASQDKGKKVLLFGDFSYYWIADRQSRTLKRLNELYAVTDQVGFIGTQRVDGKLILPEAVQVMALGSGTAANS